MQAALTGFGTGLGLILAIGSQNAFVLRQGLRGEHVLAVCLVCALSDAVLVTLGVSGFQQVVARVDWIEPVFRWLGAAFLAVYGTQRLWAAWRGTQSLAPAGDGAESLGRALASCLAFTWLNPHVWLDTVFLLGAVSTRYPGQGLAFALGAVTASFVFFFALGYGAALLRPLFARPGAWRVLDGLVGLMMWAIAVQLARGG